MKPKTSKDSPALASFDIDSDLAPRISQPVTGFRLQDRKQIVGLDVSFVLGPFGRRRFLQPGELARLLWAKIAAVPR